MQPGRNTASEFTFSFTEKAAKDLDEILEYHSTVLRNPRAANYAELLRVMDELCAFPESGIPVENPLVAVSGIRKMLVKNYSLYYLSDTGSRTIVVLRIVYSRRDLNEILHSLTH